MILNYLSFVEVDPNSHIGFVGTNHLDFTAHLNEDCYIYKDFGAGFFGDFEHQVDIQATAVDAYEIGYFYLLSNDLDDVKGLNDASKSFIGLRIHGALLGVQHIKLTEGHSGTMYADEYAFTEGTWYYLTIIKTGTGLSCKIYSDSNRTNLLHTLQLTLHADHQLRYLFGCNSWNSGSSSAYNCTLDIENLALKSFPYSTPTLVRKRVKDIPSDLVDDDLKQNIIEAAGIIDAAMTDTLQFTFDSLKHGLVRQCSTDLAAFLSIIYDPEGAFTTLLNAELTANLLWNSTARSLSLLSDPRIVTYMKGL